MTMDASNLCDYTLYARIKALPPHERRMVEECVKRLEMGRKQYGEWKAQDTRNCPQEATEEVIDALQYCYALLVRLKDENEKP